MIRLSNLDADFFNTRIDEINDHRSETNARVFFEPISIGWKEDHEYRSWGVKTMGVKILPQVIHLFGTMQTEADDEDENVELDIDTDQMVVEIKINSSDSLYPSALNLYDNKIEIEFS